MKCGRMKRGREGGLCLCKRKRVLRRRIRVKRRLNDGRDRFLLFSYPSLYSEERLFDYCTLSSILLSKRR